MAFRVFLLGLGMAMGIAAPAYATTQVKGAPPDIAEIAEIIPQLDQAAAKILEKYSPETHAFVFIGRSPTALRDYMILVGKARIQAYQIPISGLSEVNPGSDTVKLKAKELFEEWLPPAKDLQGKKLVLIDYTNTRASSLLNFKTILKQYAEGNGYALPEEVATVSLRWHGTLKPEERGAIEGVDFLLDFKIDAEFGKMLNYSRFREVAPVPFFDLLRTKTIPKKEKKLAWERIRYLVLFKNTLAEYGLNETRKVLKLPPPDRAVWAASPCFVIMAGVGFGTYVAGSALEMRLKAELTRRR